jgi:hypothetical protein
MAQNLAIRGQALAGGDCPGPFTPAPKRAKQFQRATAPHEIALERLLQAHRCAKHFGQPVWQFALDIEDLIRQGLSEAGLGELVGRADLEHRFEMTRATDRQRKFREASRRTFTVKSCFVLTDKGAAAATECARSSGREETGAGILVPQWDQELRELRFGGVLVKEFKEPARNQESLLDAFQESSWCRRIDDPLPPTAGIEIKQRFHDAYVRLNCHQKHRLLRFRGDGTGEGCTWEAAFYSM